MFHLWQTLVAALAGTLAMTLGMRIGRKAGVTEIDMPLILGLLVRRSREQAKPVGIAMHVLNGLVFGVIYALVWWAADPAEGNAWWIGLLLGGVHGIAVITLMPVMSAMHPRADAPEASAAGEATIRPLGFGGRNFGKATPVGIVLNHLLFGLVWGLVFWALI